MAKAKAKNDGTSANLGFEAQLWATADAMRNNMDAREYKHVVLGLIFLKYISDAFEARHAELEAQKAQGADPEDRDAYRAASIFWFPKEARWPYLKANAPQATIGTLIDDAMTAKLRSVWRRGRGRSLASTIAELNPVLRGWVASYRMVDTKGSFEVLDAWTRRKLRGILWRQWKRPGTRLKRLRQRGVDASCARAGAMNSRGPWWNAGASHMHQAVPTAALRQLGLVSLLDEHRRLARSV